MQKLHIKDWNNNNNNRKKIAKQVARYLGKRSSGEERQICN